MPRPTKTYEPAERKEKRGLETVKTKRLKTEKTYSRYKEGKEKEKGHSNGGPSLGMASWYDKRGGKKDVAGNRK